MCCFHMQAQQNFARRDLLLKLQGQAQGKWEEAKVFEADAPAEGEWPCFWDRASLSLGVSGWRRACGGAPG
jgi:hypothetical protein